ncbi:hypothetical protein, partial [Gordonia sp. (in: high G+C Gram-positive bacteria)]|uniref:hypothetical protein n=1 Tax=Gordonia sp. (in: high G+C Gram-positive bacteria) TaxID=84139 RepID=UPI0039E6FFDF
MSSPTPLPFAVDPAEVLALARSWRRSGHVLANLEVVSLAHAEGSAECMRVARTAAEPLARIGRDVADRLDALSRAVARLESSAVADDEAAARALAALA